MSLKMRIFEKNC